MSTPGLIVCGPLWPTFPLSTLPRGAGPENGVEILRLVMVNSQ